MSSVETKTIETQIPARLDRLPWAKFHWMVIIGLGTVWILDGLEVTMVGSVASRLTEKGSGIPISTSQIGTAAAFYVAGACLGALFFGQLTDRFGRKKLFVLTLALYITATTATAFAWTPWYFFACRFFTGAGIGGEYAAINSAIDELIPARVRGRVDLIINGSYWIGSAAGAAAALLLLDTSIFAEDFGWRLAFGIGAVLGLSIMLVRRHVPESPRWLFIHGREEEAERIVGSIEQAVEEETDEPLEEPEDTLEVRQRERIPFREIAKTAFKVYPRRAWLGLALFVGQAFIYNGVTFNLGTLITTFFDVSSSAVPIFIVIFALANFLGPVTLGRLFDTVGRKPMITGCYLGSALVATVMGVVFLGGGLNKWTFEAFIVATFFLASAGASAAYLTVSEIFPMETRALAIAFFYAVGTAVGGITGPLLFADLIGSGERGQVAIAFFIGAAVMSLGGISELLLGVRAEQESLEDVAKPLTAEDAEGSDDPGAAAGSKDEDDEDDERSADFSAAHAAILELRRDAMEMAASGQQHRARLHELRAERGRDSSEDERIEELLARADEMRARAMTERADGLEAVLEADDAEKDEARERCRAASERAEALEEGARAIVSDSDVEEQLHHHLAEAATERARAADARIAAAARRRDSAELDEAARAEQDRQQSRSSLDEQRRAKEDADRRIRERLAQRRDRDRRGIRRYRPGPGSGRYGRGMLSTPSSGDRWRQEQLGQERELEREVDIIARALQDHGTVSRHELERLVGARFWGPGRFRAALREALEEGRAQRRSHSSFAPAKPAEGQRSRRSTGTRQ